MKPVVLGLFLIVMAGSTRLEAHAFLERAEPPVGSTMQASPSEVRVLFTEKIEPALSSVQVFDKVVWRVGSVDTHITKGSFTFRVVR